MTRQDSEAARAPREASREATGRRARVPLGSSRQKLTASQREGYQRRWVNDVPGRVEMAQEAGYEFVTADAKANSSDPGANKSAIVGVNADGTPLRAYLMEIPADWYQEDQKAKQSECDRVDEAIRRAAPGKTAAAPKGSSGADEDKFYTPREGASIKHERR